MTTSDRPVVRLHMWLETREGVFFGIGRVQLLELIERTGSLKAAAERMGMSYRAAWGKIKTSEKIIGFKLIEKIGGNRSGYRLTEFGRLLTENFRDWYEDVERQAVARAQQIFLKTASRFAGKRETYTMPPPGRDSVVNFNILK